MTDMLVKLYNLPPLDPEIEAQRAHGITIRRPLGAEKHFVIDWIRAEFGDYWASETDVCFAHQPISCFIAKDNAVIGFGCYDATAKGFFGPTGVGEAARGKGTGRALLIACMHALKWEGYGYAIIGGVGPKEFYAKGVGAVEIPDSTPGMYADMLHADNDEDDDDAE